MAGGMFALFVMSWLASGTESLHWNAWVAEQGTAVQWTLTLLVALLVTGSLAWRQANQVVVLVLVMVGAVAHLVIFDAPNWMLLALPLAMYAVARWGSRRLALITVGLTCVWALVASPIWLWPRDRHDARDFVLMVISVMSMQLISYLLARAVRTNAEKALSEAASAEQVARADAARMRTEIARELHDVVAHSLSVMVVQAEGGQATAAKDPAMAAQALATIASVGRESLGEMRHIVGLLRDTRDAGSSDLLRPHPTMDDIPTMVAKTGIATLTVVGQPRAVPPTTNAVAFRVIQESLTNVLKHAGPQSKAQVRIEYTPDAMSISVIDDGGGLVHDATEEIPGQGVKGMRERVMSVGGYLLTGPTEEGGFRVQARLPLAKPRSEETP